MSKETKRLAAILNVVLGFGFLGLQKNTKSTDGAPLGPSNQYQSATNNALFHQPNSVCK
jgi:hypothetical protein